MTEIARIFRARVGTRGRYQGGGPKFCGSALRTRGFMPNFVPPQLMQDRTANNRKGRPKADTPILCDIGSDAIQSDAGRFTSLSGSRVNWGDRVLQSGVSRRQSSRTMAPSSHVLRSWNGLRALGSTLITPCQQEAIRYLLTHSNIYEILNFRVVEPRGVEPLTS